MITINHFLINNNKYFSFVGDFSLDHTKFDSSNFTVEINLVILYYIVGAGIIDSALKDAV